MMNPRHPVSTPPRGSASCRSPSLFVGSAPGSGLARSCRELCTWTNVASGEESRGKRDTREFTFHDAGHLSKCRFRHSAKWNKLAAGMSG
jgi:hypothetical protein